MADIAQRQRRLVRGMALASTALASPSMARDGDWYIAVDGGIALFEDTTNAHLQGKDNG